MSKKLYEETNIRDIAAAIREKNGAQDSYTVAQMGNAVRAIHTQPDLEVLNATENGNYLPSVGKDGFSSVSVNVESGEAVVQPLSVTQNGIYNPPSGVDGFSPVTVNVSGGGDIYKQTIPIPNNVNFVEYLQSSGTQYIDTEIVADSSFEYVIKFKRLGNYYGPFGAFDSATGLRQFGIIGTSGGYRIGFGGYTDVSDTSSSIHTVIAKSGTTIDSEKKPSFTTPATLTLFANKSASTVNKGNSLIYRLSIYNNGVPIADYLPCLDGDGVACMWDNIAGEYVYNDGTGDFAYGNTITPTPLDDVYYLKENGAWHVIEG